VRSDPDAAEHKEGGGNRAYGIKFAAVSTRCQDGPIILAVEHVEQDEAQAALDMLHAIRPLAPGALAVVWDKALRGVHLDEIYKELGLIPVVEVHAKENPEGRKGRQAGTFVPKTVDLEEVEITSPDGSRSRVMVASDNGWASIKTLTDTGDPHYEHLECVHIQPHEDKHGFRWYGFYRLPEEYGGSEIRLALHQTKEDDRRKINRTENLRAFPEDSEDFKRLHRLRPDAESVNNTIESSLFKKRASAKGWRRVMVDLIGHATLVNAVTLARCRARENLELTA
jgi:hypothetical protein